MSLRIAKLPEVAATLMLVALLPSVLYVGHWSLHVPVPGTGAFVAIGMRAEHEAQESEGGHEEHCHGTASCTDSPPAPVPVGFALLHEGLALLGAAGALILLTTLAWRPGTLAAVAPLLPPPRGAAA
ncbi:MAG: hypothetical protein ACRDHF_08330 [Tepidiformaceae bacterium]